MSDTDSLWEAAEVDITIIFKRKRVTVCDISQFVIRPLISYQRRCGVAAHVLRDSLYSIRGTMHPAVHGKTSVKVISAGHAISGIVSAPTDASRAAHRRVPTRTDLRRFPRSIGCISKGVAKALGSPARLAGRREKKVVASRGKSSSAKPARDSGHQTVSFSYLHSALAPVFSSRSPPLSFPLFRCNSKSPSVNHSSRAVTLTSVHLSSGL